MEQEKQKIIRCIGYKIKDGVRNKCRNKIRINKNEISLVDYFCCNEHKSKNIEDLMECCDMCGEEVNKLEEVIILKCNHAYHKQCYYKWLNRNTKNICPICLFEYDKHKKTNKKKFRKKKENNNANINVSFNTWEDSNNEETNNQESQTSSWDTENNSSNNWNIPSLNLNFNNSNNNSNNNLSETLNQNDIIDFSDINEVQEQKNYLDDIKNTINKWKTNETFDMSNIDFDKIIDDIDNCKKKIKYDFMGKLINTLYCKINLNDNNVQNDKTKLFIDKLDEFVSDEKILNSYNKNVNNIIDIMKKNNIDDNILKDVIIQKILNSGLFDKDEFDEYYDVHGITEININSKYYELFQSIPDINIS